MSLLTGPVEPGRIVKLCGERKGSSRCGRVARVYSTTRSKLLCNKCVDVRDTDTQPVEDDGAQFAGPAPATMMINCAEVARQMAEVANG